MLLPLVLYLFYCLEFFKFSTPSQNVEVYIHQSCIEIGLSEVDKFLCKKNDEKDILHVSM